MIHISTGFWGFGVLGFWGIYLQLQYLHVHAVPSYLQEAQHPDGAMYIGVPNIVQFYKQGDVI